MICSVRNCGRSVLAREMCSRHYNRWLKGNPVGRIYKPRDLSPEDWFWARVEQTESGCWEWNGPLVRGYCQFYVRPGVKVYGHRFAYEQLVGPIPEGLTLDHLCRNPPCVNPAHMDPVPIRENVRRAVVARRAERAA